ncbi:MAG: hypothetical protein ACTSRI_18760 [Promethearchaeota archaeon]
MYAGFPGRLTINLLPAANKRGETVFRFFWEWNGGVVAVSGDNNGKNCS